MKKKVLFLVVILILTLSAPAFAAQTRATDIIPGISFNGTTAKCTVVVSGDKSTDEIQVDIELWQGTKKIASWSKEGLAFVSFSDTVEVTAGESYTLKVYATINGVSKPMVSTSSTCPKN